MVHDTKRLQTQAIMGYHETFDENEATGSAA